MNCQQQDIQVKLILATRPPYSPAGYGLVTVQALMPRYLWTEMLTHKRLARNASSHRAMSSERSVDLGYYIPDIFYEQGEGGMKIGRSALDQTEPFEVYDNISVICAGAVKRLSKLGISKEQANRLLPTNFMINTLMTGTESAWKSIFKLRMNESADIAMRNDLMQKIYYAYTHAVWKTSIAHLPFVSVETESSNDYNHHLMVSAARCARITYGNVKETQEDYDLALKLRNDNHLSPFEHQAVWSQNPKLSALCSVIKEDMMFCDSPYLLESYYGWSNFRSEIEEKK